MEIKKSVWAVENESGASPFFCINREFKGLHLNLFKKQRQKLVNSLNFIMFAYDVAQK